MLLRERWARRYPQRFWVRAQGKIGFSGMGNEKIQDLIGRRLVTAMENNGARQKIAPVEKYIG
jgi:hypothetical protein